jgi:hypothetical protein
LLVKHPVTGFNLDNRLNPAPGMAPGYWLSGIAGGVWYFWAGFGVPILPQGRLVVTSRVSFFELLLKPKEKPAAVWATPDIKVASKQIMQMRFVRDCFKQLSPVPLLSEYPESLSFRIVEMYRPGRVS